MHSVFCLLLNKNVFNFSTIPPYRPYRFDTIQQITEEDIGTPEMSSNTELDERYLLRLFIRWLGCAVGVLIRVRGKLC